MGLNRWMRIKGLVRAVKLVMIANKMAPYGKKQSWNRSVREEFEPLDEMSKATQVRCVKEIMSCMFVDFDDGISLSPLMLMSHGLSDFALNSVDFLPVDRLSKEQMAIHEQKVALVVGEMMYGAFSLITREFDSERTTKFIECVCKRDPEMFERMLSRALHVKAKSGDFKVVNYGKFSHADIDKEVSRITDMLYSSDDKTVRPELTAEALRVIASSVAAVADIDDVMATGAHMKKHGKAFGGVDAPDSPATKSINRRMLRLETGIDRVCDDMVTLCKDMPIGNPGDIAKHITESMAQRMSKSMDDIHRSRGGFGCD